MRTFRKFSPSYIVKDSKLPSCIYFLLINLIFQYSEKICIHNIKLYLTKLE